MDTVQEAGPLTDDEITELRRWQAGADLDDRAEQQIRRALDELVQLRRSLWVTEALRKAADELAEARRKELQRYRIVDDAHTQNRVPKRGR